MKKGKPEIYVAEQICYGIPVQKRDKEDKPIFKKDRNGNDVAVTTSIKFTPVELRISKGYLCKFFVREDTDNFIKEAVREAYKNDATVMTEEEYIKKINPLQSDALTKLAIAEDALSIEKTVSIKATSELTKAQDVIAEMQAKLKAKETKGK